MKRLSGRTPYLGKAIARAVSSVNPFRKNGFVLYGPSEADPAIPDLRIGHDNQWFKILTGDPSSAGQPLQIVNEPFTITVHHDPSEGADYTTVRDAMLYCARFYAPPELTTIYGTILIKSGHIEKAQTQLRNANLAWCEIVSEDNDVVVETAAMLGDPYFSGGGNALWLMRDVVLPVLKTHFVADVDTGPYRVGFNLHGCLNTLPPRDNDYYTDVDLYSIPGKRTGCSGFDLNLVLGGNSSYNAMPHSKFTNCRRDRNVSIGGIAGMACYGGDYTGYRSQCSVYCSGSLYIAALPFSTDLPFRSPVPAPSAFQYVAPDFRKDPAGTAPQEGFDIILGEGAWFNRRGGFYGTCNVPTNYSVASVGDHHFHQSGRNPRLFQSDMFGFEPATRKEMLPDPRAYKHALAAVREGYPDDGEGVLTLYISDRGEWRPLQAGGLVLPPPPTFTDNGDGTFTLT